MSDLRNLSIKELSLKKQACEAHIERLHAKLGNGKASLMCINIFLKKKEKEEIKAKVVKFMEHYEEE